jgi:hypothetical protein
MWIPRPAVFPALLLLIACSKREAQTTAPVDAAVAEAPDGGNGTAALELSVRERLLDGGVGQIELRPHERAPIEPTQQLEIVTSRPLLNYRIRVFDEADRAVISDDVAESSEQRLDYQISFAEPLKPGHRYTLVLDAQSGATFSDERGNAQPERRLELQVVGEREKATPKKHAAKKRRHR